MLLTAAVRKSEANTRLAANHWGEMGVKPLGNALHTMALFTEAPERELHGAKQHIAVWEDCVGFPTNHTLFFRAADNKRARRKVDSQLQGVRVSRCARTGEFPFLYKSNTVRRHMCACIYALLCISVWGWRILHVFLCSVRDVCYYIMYINKKQYVKPENNQHNKRALWIAMLWK